MAIIAIDFDGTIVTHDYPDIGKDIGAFPVLKKLQEAGHKLILFTMRSGTSLNEAVELLTSKGIKFWGVNINPDQHTWTDSRKVYAQIYIDDAALGVPLIVDPAVHGRPYVDWYEVERMLKKTGILGLDI